MESFLVPWDYAVIGATLVLSAALGLYHGCYRTRQSTFLEYVLGSRTIPIFPIVMSSFATITASGLMIGFPSEVYSYGAGGLVCVLAWALVIPVTNHVFAPVYRQLESGNIFQFYEIRYTTGVKKFVTALYVAIMGIFSSITIFGPATALSLVTGLHVWIIISVMVGLCMLYTILGGMRAVVFADTIQGLQMLISIVVLITVGTVSIGGLGQVWTRNLEGERLHLDFSLDFTVTQGVWSSTIAWTFAYMSFFVINQPNMQRLLACATLEQAQRANTISCIIAGFTQFLASCLGLLAYAAFSECDPFSTGKISNMNQIVSFYIMHTFTSTPGLPGMYFAGLLSASLSTVSSVVNSMAAISVETFIASKRMSDARRTNICKLLASFYGVLALAGVFLTEMFPNTLQAAVNLAGTTTAPLFGLFIIGVFCPEANRKGCIVALGISLIIAVWLVTGGLLFPMVTSYKPLSVNGCLPLEHGFNLSTEMLMNHSVNLNVPDPTLSLEQLKMAFPLHGFSYLWFPIIITLSLMILCIGSTYIFGRDVPDVQLVQLIPRVVKRYHRCVGPKLGHYLLCSYVGIEAKSTEWALKDGPFPLRPD